MKKALYFCDFCESIRPHMSENSTIKKYRQSFRKFVEDDADIEVRANKIRIFYPLILKARTYLTPGKNWLEITQTMASRLKNGDYCVPPDYIPTQREYERAVDIASEFFSANIIPNMMSGMRTLVSSNIIELVQENCASLQAEELMSRYKISNDADFLAAVFISSLAHNHKRHAAVSARVKSQYTGIHDKRMKARAEQKYGNSVIKL